MPEFWSFARSIVPNFFCTLPFSQPSWNTATCAECSTNHCIDVQHPEYRIFIKLTTKTAFIHAGSSICFDAGWQSSLLINNVRCTMLAISKQKGGRTQCIIKISLLLHYLALENSQIQWLSLNVNNHIHNIVTNIERLLYQNLEALRNITCM